MKDLLEIIWEWAKKLIIYYFVGAFSIFILLTLADIINPIFKEHSTTRFILASFILGFVCVELIAKFWDDKEEKI